MSPETSPAWKTQATQAKGQSLFPCPLAAGKPSPLTATQKVTSVHRWISRAFLLRPFLLPSASLQGASTTFLLTRGCTRYSQHCSSRILRGTHMTLFDLPESQGHVSPSSHRQHNHLNVLRTMPGCLHLVTFLNLILMTSLYIGNTGSQFGK